MFTKTKFLSQKEEEKDAFDRPIKFKVENLKGIDVDLFETNYSPPSLSC